jgi:hypothetical protein
MYDESVGITLPIALLLMIDRGNVLLNRRSVRTCVVRYIADARIAVEAMTGTNLNR